MNEAAQGSLGRRAKVDSRPGSTRRGLIPVIFLKEINEMFRDRRTRFGAIVSPLLITPLMIFISGQFVANQQKTEAKTVYAIGIVNGAASPAIEEELKHTPYVTVVDVSAAQADSMVQSRKIKAAVVIPDSAGTELASDNAVSVTILSDQGNDVSMSAAGRVRESLKNYGQMLLAQRLREHGLTQQFGTPVLTVDRPVKGGGSTVMYLLAMFIPYVLALSAFSGGMYAANDQIAGEKERGTMETLLVSPASRREIVLGKFGAVACVCLCSGFLSVIGLTIPFLVHSQGLFGGQGAASLGALHMTLRGVLTIMAAQVPLALLFAGLLVAVSTYARNQKEVQVYQAPLLMLILVPAMGSMFVSTDIPLSAALVPVLNSTIVIKQVLAGVTNPAFLLLALISSAVYASIGIFVSVRLFENERVLLKT
jgi:sodium transport system permease protein